MVKRFEDATAAEVLQDVGELMESVPHALGVATVDIEFTVDQLLCKTCNEGVASTNSATLQAFAKVHVAHEGYTLVGRITAPYQFVSGQTFEMAIK